MNKRALQVLEYDKIINQLTNYASTPLGKKECEELIPMEHFEDITFAQRQTADALSRIIAHGSISFSGTRDIRESLARLNVGSTLSAPELLSIASVLRVALRVSAYGRREMENISLESEVTADSLDELFSSIVPLSVLGKEIDRCIISEEEIADDASAGLKEVRRLMAATSERVRVQMNTVLISAKNYLQDNVITMRGGRYCLPVKAENRAFIDGIVHDQSGSGSTLFIEPSSVVKLNNELRELKIRETKEIEKVLATLSASCALEIENLSHDLMVLSHLDFIFAKALLAKDMKASEPIFNTQGHIRIKKGRHPLIDAKKAVPIDIELGYDFNCLVVTGPNTGGKTVSLKTVGLLTLLGQAGLHIPAFDHSELAVFREIYADIGDEQSIEQSLSTFSSHMTNIVSFLEKADQDCLVLFDELGAGTDPTEGAALAISILTFLHNLGVPTMATTHYSELKVFALTTPGATNASCEFDVDTLRPTYRLLIGVPGKSNAFAISARLGIPGYIIDDAKAHLDANDIRFEDLLSSLDQARRQVEAEQEEIARLRKEADALKEEALRRQADLDSKKNAILAKAEEEAAVLLANAKAYADTSIRNVNRLCAQTNVNRELERERTALNQKIKEQEERSSKAKKAANGRTPAGLNAKKLTASDLHIGDSVFVTTMNVKGSVSSLPNAKGELFVQMGIMRTSVHLEDIELLQEEDALTPKSSSKKGRNSSISSGALSKAASISPEINLIGMMVDEAMAVLDKYLDDAYLSHLPKVRIVHGRGTGALRKATHQKLKRTAYVADFRLGEYGEGDTGVTIAEFKTQK